MFSFTITLMSPQMMIVVLLFAAGVMAIPTWKTQFYKFHKWTGHFEYPGQSHLCTMAVHSIQKDDNGGAMVTFYDVSNHTHLDMNVYSQNDVSIVFRQETVYHSDAGEFYKDFEFVAELVFFHDRPWLIGNLTRPSFNFSIIQMLPVRNHTSSGKNITKSSALSIGLSVGIAMALLIICIVAGILLLRWGIRSGYLRHVARSYKSFRNPEGPVSFDNTQPSQQESSVNVHI